MIGPRPRLFAACAAAMAVFGLALALPGTAFGVDEVRVRLGLDLATQARLISVLFLGFFASTLVAGPLADVAGRRLAFVLSCTLLAAGLAGFAVARGAPTALAAVLLLGLGASGVNTVANTIAAELYPARRGAMLSWLALASGVGGALLPFLAMAGASVSWTFVLAAAAIVAAVSGLGAAGLAFPAPPGTRAPLTWPDVRGVVGAPGFAWFLLALACQGGNEASLAGWMTAYLSSRGFGSRAALGTLGLHWTAIVASRAAAGLLVERVGKRAVITAGAAAASGGTLLLVCAPTPATLVAGAVVAGLGISSVFSTVLAAAGDRYTHRTGTMYGVLLAGAQLGGMALPSAVGAIAEARGLAAGLGLLVVTTAVVGAVMWRVGGKGR
ncbi:MAG: sugar MFS transporter [Vicinamibacterales bacterium]